MTGPLARRSGRASRWRRALRSPASSVDGGATLSACLRTQLGGLRLDRGLSGEAAGHDGDHGPVDVGLLVGGQPFVVPHGPPVAGDPGQGPLDDPTAGQDLEGVQVIGAPDDFESQLWPEPGPGPGDQIPGVAAVGPRQPYGRKGPPQVPQQRPGRVAVLHRRGGDQRGKIKGITPTRAGRMAKTPPVSSFRPLKRSSRCHHGAVSGRTNRNTGYKSAPKISSSPSIQAHFRLWTRRLSVRQGRTQRV
jgi:hypothetical protein